MAQCKIWYNLGAMVLPEQIQNAFPARPLDLHKYSAGTVAIVGGSHRFIHAPAIAGLGARAAGAGLVHLVVPDASRIAAGNLVPEATFLKQTANCVPPKADVLAVGMGLGVSSTSEMLVSRLLSGSAGRFLLDADALAVLANWYANKTATLPVFSGQTLILTPHTGEAARLLACTSDEINADRRGALERRLHRFPLAVDHDAEVDDLQITDRVNGLIQLLPLPAATGLFSFHRHTTPDDILLTIF